MKTFFIHFLVFPCLQVRVECFSLSFAPSHLYVLYICTDFEHIPCNVPFCSLVLFSGAIVVKQRVSSLIICLFNGCRLMVFHNVPPPLPRRKAFPMSDLWEGFYPEALAPGPPAYAHRREAICLHRLHQSSLYKALPTGAHEPASKYVPSRAGFIILKLVWYL